MVIFSRDEALVDLLRRGASRPLLHLSNLGELRALLNRERVDAVLVDCDDHTDGIAALRSVAGSEANRQSPCMAITNGEMAHADAKDFGGWIVVEKTSLWSTPDQVHSWLSSVQKRRHERFSLPLNGVVDSGSLMGRQVTLHNISAGGASFQIHGADELEPNLTLRLAGHRLRCDLVWRDGTGNVGVRFLPGQLSEIDLRKMVQDFTQSQSKK